ncbi:MAG: DNA polymerase III subunit delta, partial [Chloroflexi bacterium]|nr:DNA polymerase III subunit delta [Chloroflexota bacterium]
RNPTHNPKSTIQNPKSPTPKQPSQRPFHEDITGELPPWTELVLLEEKLHSRNPLLEGLRPLAAVVEFPLLKGHELDAWIVDRARLAGSSIAPQAVRLLATRIGSDLRQMASELTKLALYVQGRTIGLEDVRLLTPIVREESIFSLLDDLMERRPGPALARLEELRQHGTTEQHILFLIARQYRQLLIAVAMRRRGATANEIQRELRLTSSYAWRKTEEHMARVQETRLKTALHQILACDVAIKTGRVEPRLALVLLLDSLSPLSASPKS